MNPTKNREKMIEVRFISLLVSMYTITCLHTVSCGSTVYTSSVTGNYLVLHDVLVFVQVMFEEYQCAGVYIAIQAVLTLYAQGKSHDHHMFFFLYLSHAHSSSIYGTPSCSYVVWGVTNGEKSDYGWEADARFCKLLGFSESSSFARSHICLYTCIVWGEFV